MTSRYILKQLDYTPSIPMREKLRDRNLERLSNLIAK